MYICVIKQQVLLINSLLSTDFKQFENSLRKMLCLSLKLKKSITLMKKLKEYQWKTGFLKFKVKYDESL